VFTVRSAVETALANNPMGLAAKFQVQRAGLNVKKAQYQSYLPKLNFNLDTGFHVALILGKGGLGVLVFDHRLSRDVPQELHHLVDVDLLEIDRHLVVLRLRGLLLLGLPGLWLLLFGFLGLLDLGFRFFFLCFLGLCD